MSNIAHDMIEAFSFLNSKNDVVQDTHGNLSYKVGDFFYIKPSGVAYDEITEYNICKIDMATGLQVSDLRIKPSVDTPHHWQIYKNNPGQVNSICHTHSPYATAYAGMGLHLKLYLSEQADYFGGDVHCDDYADLDHWGLYVDLDKACSDKAVLLGGHGALTFGKNPMEAVKRAVALEMIAKKNHLIESMMRPKYRREPSAHGFNRADTGLWHDRYTNGYGQK